MTQEEQRAQWRRVSSRIRLRAQEQKSLATGYCSVKRNGSGKRCGKKLEVRLMKDGYGIILSSRHVCPSCERRRAGLCQRCPRPVAGRKGFALYCDDAECRRIVRKAWRIGLDPRSLA
jgi:hypothetical protein